MAEYNKRITCLRCGADLGARTTRPQTNPKGFPFALDIGRDVVSHLCDSTGMDTPCFVWRWGRGTKGYPRVNHLRRNERVGRILLGITGSNAVMMHTCDNPPCVNVDHLPVGTNGMNNTDRAAKGRSAVGADNPNSKLTAEDVRVIRQRLASGELHKVIAADYGVHKTTIGYIHRRRTWDWIPKETP